MILVHSSIIVILFILLLAVRQKRWIWLLVISVVAVIVAVSKSRENFETMFRDDLNFALNTRASMCGPFGKIPADSRPTIVKTRGLHKSKNGENKCVIRMDDNPLFKEWSCDNNGQLFRRGVTEDVKEIYDTDIFNPDVVSTSKYCEITFNDNATPDSLLSYAVDLEENEPTKKRLKDSIRELSQRAQNAEELNRINGQQLAETRSALNSKTWEAQSAANERDAYKSQSERVSKFADTLNAENNRFKTQNATQNIITGFTPNNMISVKTVGHKCLDGGVKAGNKVYLWDCAGVDNQRWTMDVKDRLVLKRDPNLCLAPAGNTAVVDGTLVTKKCDDNPSMKWFYDKATTELKNHANPGLCLDVKAFQFENGNDILTWHCHGGTNQQWAMRQ